MLVALRNGTNLRYIHQDSLGSTSVVTDSSGAQYGYTRYYPYGSTRDSSGSLDTDKKFTGQRLDGTGLYYYGARYYDPTIGRFISADTLVPNPTNPQSLNRYSYCLNNPLRYVDPSGHQEQIDWGCDAEGHPLAPPAAAFGPGGYYGGQYGVTIPYNSDTTVNGPPVSEPQSAQADNNLPVSNGQGFAGTAPTPYTGPTPCPQPTPTPTPYSGTSKWGRAAAALTLGVGATITEGVEIGVGIVEIRTGNPLGFYEIGHGFNMVAVGILGLIGGFISLFN